MPGEVTKPSFLDNSKTGFLLSTMPEPISKNKAHIFSYGIKRSSFACFSNSAFVYFSLNPHPIFYKAFLNLAKSTNPLSSMSKNLKAFWALRPSSFLTYVLCRTFSYKTTSICFSLSIVTRLSLILKPFKTVSMKNYYLYRGMQALTSRRYSLN